MGKQAEIVALRAEVAGLRSEVALLRSQQAAHICPSWPQPSGGGVWPAPSPQCTCGTSLRCMKHCPADWGNVWINYCAGAAPVPQTYIVNTAGATHVPLGQSPGPLTNNVCAGPQPLLTFNVPA